MVIAAKGSSIDQILGWLPLLIAVAVGAALPFGLLAAVVLLSRSGTHQVRRASFVPAFVFLVATVIVTLRIISPSVVSIAIGLVSAALVSACGLALLLAATSSHNRVAAGVAKWSGAVIAVSLVLGVGGVIGFTVLDIPVRQIGIYQGIGPSNRDTFEILLSLRNQGPMAISILAAGLGALAWRATGRTPAALATLLGCAGIAVNLLTLVEQSGD
jgi:hypothetical protein